ncbi:MAG: MOSC N-terminal beta barrel domain-containing protein [Chloroflexota bacterium]
MIGTVTSITRYPVKAMLGESLNAALVTSQGLAGDRRYALIDSDGRIGTPKIPRRWKPIFQSRSRYIEEPDGESLPAAEITLPDGERIRSSDNDVEARLSALLGFEARLITEKPPGLILESPPLGTVPDDPDAPTINLPVVNGFFDLGSLHLITTATLNSLRSLNPDVRFEPRRFRPNFMIDTGDAAGFVENDWPGKTIAIGDDVRIRVMMPTIRCVVTTLPQDDLPSEPGVLKTAAQHNSANVGVYAMVEQGGMVRRGDEVRIEG